MIERALPPQPVITLSGWRRHGECNNCGWCCVMIGRRALTITPKPAPGEVEPDWAFLKVRGFVRAKDGRATQAIELHAPCWEHDAEKLRCTIYEDRPPTCRAFPVDPTQIEGTPCSYYFERGSREDGTFERRGGTGAPITGEG